ncbi:hypothetical protein PRIPAC_82179 [Pristionchus pacificus]|uniref:Uncharacterized protein n=1 Tax=Pristionchus pacificus TaxID=54126 RepID=A0A2A6BYW7_PRIPA|nr:hypothetical protein PRIPAC_82179 [Pristionchus pacificus]|eukprot:PDM70963.1 hypothetical protein PRIPAC_44359 [Pristionchus pacificus]
MIVLSIFSILILLSSSIQISAQPLFFLSRSRVDDSSPVFYEPEKRNNLSNMFRIGKRSMNDEGPYLGNYMRIGK